MAQAVSRLPLTAETLIRSRFSLFVVDRVTVGQVFLRVLHVSPVNILPGLHTYKTSGG
jgi:hypothetical protein